MLGAACTAIVLAVEASAGNAPLHVPSPDWRDQVIYFLMTDRFEDGDASNNSQGAGEYDPADPNRYHGGDLTGVRRRLDYIQGLGATAVWLTPPVANVWWDPALKMAGYHGYWTEHFGEVDKHLGTLEDYRALSMDLHGREMFLVQDIVANHTGDFFTVEGGAFRPKAGVVPSRPSQPPFDRLDEEVYHRTPEIKDFNDESQRLTFQLSGLDDLNTASPVVRDALRAAYGSWITKAGVDAFRIDTAHYVEHEFWKDFVHSRSTSAPGILEAAERTGRRDFLTFGEVWVHSAPSSDDGERVAAAYLGTEEAPELGAVLNFPLADDLRAVFAKGEAPERLSYRLEGLNRHFRGGRASVNFFDNHDMTRLAAEGPEEGVAQALAVLLTIPGLPVLYAGTEQGLRETRAPMFGRFDEHAPLVRLIRDLTRLRRESPALRRGRLTALHGARGGPGLLAYRLESPEERLLVLVNTGDAAALAANLDTGLAPRAVLDPAYSRRAGRSPASVDGKGRLSLRLPPRAVRVFRVAARRAPAGRARVEVAIERVEPDGAERLRVSGRARGAHAVELAVDGRPVRTSSVAPDALGRWTAELELGSLADGEHALVAVAGVSESPAVSEPRTFSVSVPWRVEREVEDPVGDDRGPTGAYRYPLAPGFEGRGDVERVTVLRRGRDLRLRIKLAKGLSTAWNPPNGFDHLSVDLFFDDPASTGTRAFPGSSARLPRDAEWDYHLFLGGWRKSLTDATGFELQPGPLVTADPNTGTIEVTLRHEAFGGQDPAGFRLLATTWDYDGVEGRLRPLAPEPGDYVFGGGTASDPPAVDDVGPFSLSN
ncbi:MAG: DUF3459 domain-containing protein [Elusimicrobia bacterium]|nr:DUF3459 domain-containing protein [Elusimicrobiota bacterium]